MSLWAEPRPAEGAPSREAPRTDEEACALLGRAARERVRVGIIGAGLGDAPGGSDLLLSSAGRRGVVHFDPADLTLTAGAGSSLESLEGVLGEAGQWLPMDPPGGGAVTLGGMVASGVTGPLVEGYGRPRDHLLGLTLIDGMGRRLVLGGRVVKNVAGFDLVRLAAGSRGRLGFVAEVTFRLFPLPRIDRTLVWSFEDSESAWRMGRALAGTSAPLGALELEGAAGGGVVRLSARLLGSPGAADSVERQLEDRAGAPGERLEGEASRNHWRRRAESAGAGHPSVRAAARPSEAGELLIEWLSGEVGDLRRERLPEWRIHMRRGVVRVEWEGDPGPSDDTTPVLDALAARFCGPGRSIRAIRGGAGFAPAPPEGREGSGAARIEEALLRSFDPAGILAVNGGGRWS